MYLVTAVINKANLKNVLEDLFSNNFEGITVSDVIGKGSFGLKEADNGMTDLVEKVKLEMVVSTLENRELAMECVRSNAHDLGRGAGKMWWIEVGGVERIRTGEKDKDALTTQIDKKIRNTSHTITTHVDTPCS
ncbi:P-II family nitrogen regulator [Sulfurimonas microaerophilic]|uniref:P-II family nitrogen regulator n=1 Tax=Sulfurimonas microaerophilic TaxID=3058392 RepID=UPI002714A347|nr:P-II family nitrogen regulator [Sulfurimonas sp. hsl 1-7]